MDLLTSEFVFCLFCCRGTGLHLGEYLFSIDHVHIGSVLDVFDVSV